MRVCQLHSIGALLKQEVTYVTDQTIEENNTLKKTSASTEQVRASAAAGNDRCSVSNGVKSIILRAFIKFEFDIEQKAKTMTRGALPTGETKQSAAVPPRRAEFVYAYVSH